MIIQPTIQNLSNPKLIDLALLDIQTGLVKCLGWLDYAFGKSEKQIDANGVVYPAIYQGDNEYLNLLPDSHLGNYCFFDIEDGQDIVERGLGSTSSYQYTANFSLICWFDFREVYPNDYEYKTVENVKADVLSALMELHPLFSSIKPGRFYDRAENIYRGYTHQEINRNFTKRPYGGFKLDGVLTYRQGCTPPVVDPIGD